MKRTLLNMSVIKRDIGLRTKYVMSITDCYSNSVNVSEYNSNNKKVYVYPTIAS